MDCAGRKIRGDNWTPWEWNLIATRLAGTFPWAQVIQPWTQPGADPLAVATAIRAYMHTSGLFNGSWGWFTFWVPEGLPNQPFRTLLYNDIPRFEWFDLLTMESWPALISDPHPEYKCVGTGLVTQGTDLFHSPWLNPI